MPRKRRRQAPRPPGAGVRRWCPTHGRVATRYTVTPDHYTEQALCWECGGPTVSGAVKAEMDRRGISLSAASRAADVTRLAGE